MKSKTAYEYGIGVGFSGISPYSFNVEGGVTSSLNSILESYKDTNSTKKEAGK